MADPQVKVVMSLVDNISGKMKGITSATGGLGSAFQSLTGFSLGAAGGVAAVALGIQKAVKFTKESIAETVAYNKTIREMTQVTGLGSEEISRIIQVGDDWGISIDSIRTSLAFMNKKGIEPSIDNLADMADSYVAATDKSKWAEEAVKTLGRGYQTLIPLLALGGDGFRDAAAGIDDSLIVTEDAMRASRKYEVELDNLTDTVTGLKYTMGNGLMPVLSDVLGSFNDLIIATQDLDDVTDKLNITLDYGLMTDKEVAEIRKGLRTGTLTLEEAVELLADANRDLYDSATMAYPEEEKFIQLYKDLRVVTADLADEQSVLSTAIGEVADGFDEQKTTADLVNEALKFVSESASALAQNTLLLELATEDLTAAEIEEKLNALDRIKALQTLNDLLMAGTITYPQWVAALADGAVTQEEINALLGITSGELSDIESKILGLDGMVANVSVVTNYTEHRDPNAPGGRWAAGTDFIVPPGFDQDNYPLGFGQSGERVVIIPKNQQGNTVNNNSFNMNIHTNAQTSSLMGDFNKMKAWAN